MSPLTLAAWIALAFSVLEIAAILAGEPLSHHDSGKPSDRLGAID